MKYDIAALKRKMLVKYPFFGSVVASVDYKENKDISTADTDGETIYYNPEYLEGLSVEEQTFIFAHEVCHIAFNHILRSEGKNPELWSIATDGVINQFLKRDGLKIAPGGVDMAEAINYDAEQLYEKLLQKKQQRQQQSGQGNQQQSSDDSQGGNNQQQPQSQQDNGETQNQEQNQESKQQSSDGGQSGDNQQQPQSQQDNGETQNQEQSQESKQQSSDGGQSGNNQQQSQSQQQGNSGSGGSQDPKKQSQEQSGGESEEDSQKEDKSKQDVGHDTHSMWAQAVKKHKEQQEKTKLEKKQEELESMGEKDAFKKNLEDKKKQLEELKEAISKQASQAGTSTNRDIRTVNDIGSAKPLIDWRYVLRDAIKYDVDWSYKNATLEDGVVSANLEEQPMPETEIVLDTSGSINEVLLKNFLRECKNILQHTKLKVGCFDTEFYGFYEIRTEEDIEKMRFEGRGGTDFDVAVGAFSRQVENKIIFTDGKASMPDMTLDAIWIVFGGKKINPKGGKVIHIDNEQLERLYNYQMTNETKERTR